MSERTHRRTLLLFGALVGYIVLQFLWWGVLLWRKHREAAQLALEVRALGGDHGDVLDSDRGLRMILGEGSVFLLLLLLMLFFTYRAIRRTWHARAPNATS